VFTELGGRAGTGGESGAGFSASAPGGVSSPTLSGSEIDEDQIPF